MDDSEVRVKAVKMWRFSALAGVQRFLLELGSWPASDEDWAAAYDLYLETRGEIGGRVDTH